MPARCPGGMKAPPFGRRRKARGLATCALHGFGRAVRGSLSDIFFGEVGRQYSTGRAWGCQSCCLRGCGFARWAGWERNRLQQSSFPLPSFDLDAGCFFRGGCVQTHACVMKVVGGPVTAAGLPLSETFASPLLLSLLALGNSCFQDGGRSREVTPRYVEYRDRRGE